MKCKIGTLIHLNCTNRCVSTLNHQYRNGNKNSAHNDFFRFKKLDRIAYKFVKIPIHYQSPRDLTATIVSAGNAFLKNPNFWKRCESATLRLINGFVISDLIHILNGFAKGGYISDKLFKRIGYLLSESIVNVKSDYLHVILLAYSTANIYIPSLIKGIEQRVALEYSKLSTSCVSLFLTSSELFNHTLNSSTIDAILPYIIAYHSSFPLEDLCRSICGLSNYLLSHSSHWDSLQNILVLNVPNLSICMYLTICKKLANMPSQMIAESLASKINEFALSQAPLIPPSQLYLLLNTVYSINKFKQFQHSKDTFNSILNYLIRQYKEVDCFDTLTVYALSQGFGLNNLYLSEIIKNHVKPQIKSDKRKSIYYLNKLKEMGCDDIIVYKSCEIIIDTLLPSIKVGDVKFLIELALIFKQYHFTQGIEYIVKATLPWEVDDSVGVDYLYLTEIISGGDNNKFNSVTDKFHPNTFAQAISIYRESRNSSKWLKSALSRGFFSLDMEIIPAMLYSLVTTKSTADEVKVIGDLLDYISNPNNLSKLSVLGLAALVKVVYYSKTHIHLITNVFDILSKTPNIETYKIAITCLQVCLVISTPNNTIIRWIIEHSKLAKGHLPLVLQLLLKCQVHRNNYHNLTPLACAIDIAMELDSDIVRIERLKELARKLNIDKIVQMPEQLETECYN